MGSNDGRVGDTAYWNAHYAKLSDQSYVKDVAEYLLARKAALCSYALRDKRPVTDLDSEQRARCSLQLVAFVERAPRPRDVQKLHHEDDIARVQVRYSAGEDVAQQQLRDRRAATVRGDPP